jgi:hypothetical protein
MIAKPTCSYDCGSIHSSTEIDDSVERTFLGVVIRLRVGAVATTIVMLFGFSASFEQLYVSVYNIDDGVS